jgi:hypothetical protein
VDSSGNVTANASLNAKAGVGGGIYMSGLSASGSGYCVIAFTGGGGTGATASVALPFVSGTSPTTIMSTGYGYTAPPSAAMVIAGGTATGCMGTSVGVTTYLNGVLNMLATSKPGGPATGNGSVWFDWYNCLVTTPMYMGTLSAYQYILQTWLSSGDRFVPVHEPTTSAAQWGEGVNNTTYNGCASGSGSVPSLTCGGQPNPPSTLTSNQTCPLDWANYFLTPFIASLATWAGVPSGITYGVALNAREMASASMAVGGHYAMEFASTVPTTWEMGLDMYDFSPSRQTEYTTTIQTYQSHLHSAFVEEFGPQAWNYTPTLPATAPTGEGCAIVGLQSCVWNTFNRVLFGSLLSFLSSQGVTDAFLYGTEMLGACAPAYPDNGQDSSQFVTVLSNATIAMQNHQYSLASAGMSAILTPWNATGLQGCSLTGGSLKP